MAVLAAVLALFFSASPASAAVSWKMRHNSGVAGCLANHHPAVFMSSCNAGYNDQYWAWNAEKGGVFENRFSLKCLAAHADGSVFTFDCNTDYADQLWRPYGFRTDMLENVAFPGRCLAAHGNGRVFLFECHPEYADQHWWI